MAKLYFRYGAMKSAKSMNLLAVHENYHQNKRNALLCLPEAAVTDPEMPMIKSRVLPDNLSKRADLVIGPKGISDKDQSLIFEHYHCVLVDEAQFLTPKAVDTLREINDVSDLPVICYGLRTDFRRKLFPGSKRLLEVADVIEEVVTVCERCHHKAIYNMRVDATRKRVDKGAQVELDNGSNYESVCATCYDEAVRFLPDWRLKTFNASWHFNWNDEDRKKAEDEKYR